MDQETNHLQTKIKIRIDSLKRELNILRGEFEALTNIIDDQKTNSNRRKESDL